MPLPSNTDLQSLDTVYLGAPFVQVEAKKLNTETLDLVYLGAPFVAVGPAEAIGLNVWVNVGGTWKSATAMYTKVSGTWKTVTDVQTRISGTWKT